MLTLAPPDPRTFRPLARIAGYSGVYPGPRPSDRRAVAEAIRRRERSHAVRCSGITQTWAEAIYTNTADYTAISSFTTETSLLSGINRQPVIPALFFDLGGRAVGRMISIVGKGVLSTTGTPTYLLTIRLGTTSGPSYISGTAVGVTAAITTQSGVTNKWFEFRLDLICTAVGIGTGNTTLAGSGYWNSPGGFASPGSYPMEPTTPDTATWTATIDNSATQYVNCSVTSSASSASNTLTLKQLYVIGWN